MHISVYQKVRKELIDDFNILENKPYYLKIPDDLFYSINEIEHREETIKNDTFKLIQPGTKYRDAYITVGKLHTIFSRFKSHTSLSFYNSGDVIEIYETIMRYLSNWMRIANDAPQFTIPNLDELYTLEDMASWLFTIYQPLKLFNIGRENNKLKNELKKSKDLKSFLLAFNKTENLTSTNEVVFESVLNKLMPERLKNFHKSISKSKEDDWLMDIENFM